MTRVIAGGRRVLAALLRVAGVGLALLHVWLLGSVVGDGRLADPVIALRWVSAVGLVMALVMLRRAGHSMVRSRQAAVVWILVVLLHAGALGGPSAPVLDDAARNVALLFVLPTASTGLVAALTVFVAGLPAGNRICRARLTLECKRRLAESACPPALDGYSPNLIPRAPPLVLHLASTSAY